ncbi:ubiquitin-like domain-containing protein [Streptomyces longispororuber]|uniref:ubiquitin-like domain-containing protein n=1 Tax=Streptomyces longispororuber TaxID=68230 RepID=UPI00210DAB75|nr:resuscitation-promoting factor [Streptomyces longispororuber]MCQ4208681.1 ubiquitin-like domain-containing protein [Streptomyces longispororuber]
MSNSPYETYEDTYGTYRPYGGDAPYAPHPQAPHEPPADTYRPAYEYERVAAADTEPLLPRQAARPEAQGGRAAARRAARRKKADQRPETLRRLLPQALVVAFLAGGTSAFVANDKAIQLTVDGKERTLHTFADDVTELLADEGVDVGEHDIVAPGRGAALASGDEVAVRYGRPVQLTLDGQRRKVWTTARTVDGALRQLGVRAEGAYVSTSRSQRIERHGLDLDVRTERSVTVLADGRRHTIRTNAATVREAVDEAGISLGGQDTTSVPPGSFPRDGQTVTVMRVTGTKEVREEAIAYATERTRDPALFQGTEVVTRAGEPGMRRVTYALRTVNGVKQKPRRVKTEVVREPRTQQVKVGTKPMPTSVAGADSLNWSGLAACESGGRPGATDATGTYGGLYQFDTRTWQSLGGSGRPQDAPAAEQTYRAKKLYVRRGASPWPHCGPRLHG